MTRVVIASSEPVLAAGWESVLVAGGLEVVGRPSDILELYQVFHHVRPDVAVIDLPLLPAPEVLRELRRLAPRCQFILWLHGEVTEAVRQAQAWGAHAIPAGTSPARFVELVNLVACFTRDNTPVARAAHLASSSLERQMIALAGYGLSNREIAMLTGSSEHSVELLLASLADRLGAEDRYELALYGLSTLREPPAGAVGKDAI